MQRERERFFSRGINEHDGEKGQAVVCQPKLLASPRDTTSGCKVTPQGGTADHTRETYLGGSVETKGGGGSGGGDGEEAGKGRGGSTTERSTLRTL